MDDEKFAQLLQVQQKQQEQITQVLQLLQQTVSANSNNVREQNETRNSNTQLDIIKHFKCDKFNPDITNPETYIDYFESKCKLWGESALNIQKQLLFSCLSPETYQELKISFQNSIPNFDSQIYENIKTNFLNLYRTKRTRYRALTDFWNCTRKPNESIEHYANTLKEISRDCGYEGEFLDRQLRDRFATGLNHKQLEIELKQKWPDLLNINSNGTLSETTFAQIFYVAQSREIAEKDTIDNEQHNIKSITDNHLQKLQYNQCKRCGSKSRHALNKCKAQDHICEECGIVGHFGKCCIKSGKASLTKSRKTNKAKSTSHKKRKTKNKKLQKIEKNDSLTSDTYESTETDYSTDEDDDLINNVKSISSQNKRIDVLINDKKCTMDWDPGSAYSIISTHFWRLIGSPLLSKGPKLRAYGNFKLRAKGLANVTVTLNGESKLLNVVVIKKAKPMLFGLEWSEIFNMKFPNFVYSIKQDSTITLKSIIDKHENLFNEELGRVKSFKVNIHIKPDAKPIHIPARPIKFGIKNNVETELKRLEETGIISEINPNDTAIEWATPTVNVLKSNGKVRICGDYRSTINPVLIQQNHPVPLFDHLRKQLANGDKFSKIDLKDAYLQFEISPKSKKYLVISTHKGYFKYNRMPFGISTAPGIFQRALEKLLEDINGVAVYFDDIAITGSNDKEHLHTLNLVFSKLEQEGYKVNIKKCSFLQPSIEYLGHTIDKNGIRPTQDKLQAISKAPDPSNVKELKSFLGFVNFYERFVPHLHGMCADLHKLTSKHYRWKWSDHERTIFNKVKKSIIQAKSLVAFDDSKPLFLACDASEKGVGAVLFHKNNTSEMPIAFASRKLQKSEMKYSVIDREALAFFLHLKSLTNILEVINLL